MRNIVYFSIVLFLAIGCGGRHKKQTSNDIQLLVGKEIKLPENLTCQIDGRDTSQVFTDENSYRLLIYNNSKGCSPCKMKDLIDWRELILAADSIFPTGKVKFIHIFNVSERMGNLDADLKAYKFNFPVYYDMHGDFEKINPLPENEVFHTMLLDKHNRVVLAGSPIRNQKMWELYKTTILN